MRLKMVLMLVIDSMVVLSPSTKRISWNKWTHIASVYNNTEKNWCLSVDGKKCGNVDDRIDGSDMNKNNIFNKILGFLIFSVVLFVFFLHDLDLESHEKIGLLDEVCLKMIFEMFLTLVHKRSEMTFRV